MPKKLTQIDFINKASIIHNNKYDYSKVIYINYLTKVNIGCSIHGVFSQLPSNHLQGSICPKCSKEYQGKLQTSNTFEFISKASKVHKSHYDYSLVDYKTAKLNVTIICPTHGEFSQKACNHLNGNGCPQCATDNRKNTLENFIKVSNLIHSNKYDYSLVKYKSATTKVKIICTECNTTFYQLPRDHYSGHGCPRCKAIKTAGFWSKSEWIELCNNKSYNPILYIIRCFNSKENFIKIGITSKSIHKRFNCKTTMPYSYEIIKEIKGSPDFIYDKEIELHRLYKKFRYLPLIYFGGQTECFNISILQDILKL